MDREGVFEDCRSPERDFARVFPRVIDEQLSPFDSWRVIDDNDELAELSPLDSPDIILPMPSGSPVIPCAREFAARTRTCF